MRLQKLSLTRESLVNLTNDELPAVAGGIYTLEGQGCQTDTPGCIPATAYRCKTSRVYCTEICK